MTKENILNALRNTKVVISPRLALATFGTSSFIFTLLTQDMDKANVQYIRQGRIYSQAPQIISPYGKIKLEGESDPNGDFFTDMLNEATENTRIFQSGLHIDLQHVTKAVHQGNYDSMLDRLHANISKGQYDEPMLTLITGVEDYWCVSLQKAALEIGFSSAWEQIQDLIDLGQLD